MKPVRLACLVAAVAAAGAAAQPPERLRPAKLVGIDSSCRPAYPPAALRAMAQGTTVIDFTVDPEGRVTGSRIERPSGPTPEHRSLDEEAAATLARCPFKPATDGEGRPVTGLVQVSYAWVVQSADERPPGAPAPHPAVMKTDDPSCKPAYPPAAVQAHAEGTSILWYRIDAHGHVVESHVVRPSGPTPEHALLDRTALDTLARCPIVPGFDDAGRPAETVVQMEHRWRLD